MPIGDDIRRATQRALAAQQTIKAAAEQVRAEVERERPTAPVVRGASAQR